MKYLEFNLRRSGNRRRAKDYGTRENYSTSMGRNN
jgi:hypothetical protein